MGCVICDRCGTLIDLDFNVEVFVKEQIPSLDVKEEWDWVCFDCLTDEEVEELEGGE